MEINAVADAFLNRAELKTLTGYVRPSKQIARLRERKIPHEVNALGFPAVPRDWKRTVSTKPEMGPVR